MAQVPNSGPSLDFRGWGATGYNYPPDDPPGRAWRPRSFLADLMGPTLYAQRAAPLTGAPPGRFFEWLAEPVANALQANAPGGSGPSSLFQPWQSAVLSRRTVPDAPVRRGAPQTVWRGSVLPFSRDEYGGVHFDPGAGFLGGLVQAVGRLPDYMSGRIDMHSPQAVQDAFQLAGLATLGGFGGAAERIGTLGMGGGKLGGKSSSFSLDYFGTPVRILQNPTAQQVQGFLSRSKYQAARRLRDPQTGDVFIWDAADPALHQLVAEQLGIKYSDELGDIIGLD